MKISKGQYLKDLMNTIPTNTIIYKTLTGIGATSLMLGKLNQDQNVIIIVPNVPVIKGKCKYYNKKKKFIRGVFEGVKEDDISEYLNSDASPKKFITTPESYGKIKDVIEEHDKFNLFQDFFLLFDECERLVQDVSYREKILLPMADFFDYDKKALISATPIALSDPRFKEQGFKEIVLEPDFDYSKDITLIESNNIELTLHKLIQENPREHYFIFHNSTDSIAHLIKRLNFEDESAVFCARDSKEKLKINHFRNVHIDFVPFDKVNFLTSRFFSAVDIHLKKHPTIIMLTDLHFAEHSTIDPLSEAIQIVGRFRNVDEFIPKKEIFHITNVNPNAVIQTEKHIHSDIEKGKHIHEFLRPYLAAATTHIGVKCVQELLKRIETSFCITSEGEVNYYLKDNRLFEEVVKSHYLNSKNLIDAYSKSGHFNVTHKIEEYTFTDKERIKLINEKSNRIKTVFETLTPVLVELAKLQKVNPMAANAELQNLRQNYPKEVNILEEIGLMEAQRLKFNIFSIRAAINEKRIDKDLRNFAFIDYLHEHFEVGGIYVPSQISKTLEFGIRQFNLRHLAANLDLLRVYFKLSDDRLPAGRDQNGRHQKGFQIERKIVV